MDTSIPFLVLLSASVCLSVETRNSPGLLRRVVCTVPISIHACPVCFISFQLALPSNVIPQHIWHVRSLGLAFFSLFEGGRRVFGWVD
jgi:hypothetical protein